jgi:hypothetical protein
MQQELEDDPSCIEDLHEVTIDGRKLKINALFSAVDKGHMKCIEFLIENGANINVQIEKFDVTQSIFAFFLLRPINRFENSNDVLECLLNNGTYNSMNCINGLQLLLCNSIRRGNVKRCKILLDHGIAFQHPSLTSDGVSVTGPLLLGNNGVAKLLLQYSADFEPGTIKEYNSQDPFHQKWAHFLISLANRFITTVHLQPWKTESSEASFLEAVQIYLAFGGYVFFKGDGTENPPRHNVLEYLERHKVEHEIVANTREKIMAMITKPMSLQGLARLAVRRSMGRHMLRNIKTLGLPTDLESFMQFDDVIITTTD